MPKHPTNEAQQSYPFVRPKIVERHGAQFPFVGRWLFVADPFFILTGEVLVTEACSSPLSATTAQACSSQRIEWCRKGHWLNCPSIKRRGLRRGGLRVAARDVFCIAVTRTRADALCRHIRVALLVQLAGNPAHHVRWTCQAAWPTLARMPSSDVLVAGRGSRDVCCIAISLCLIFVWRIQTTTSDEACQAAWPNFQASSPFL